MSRKGMLVLSCLLLVAAAGFSLAQDPPIPEAGQPEEVVQTLKFGISPDALWWIAPVASLLALAFAVFFYKTMMKDSEGTDKMKEIAQHVREGAYAYLYSQYRVVRLINKLIPLHCESYGDINIILFTIHTNTNTD